MSKTLTEKIFSKASNSDVAAGDLVNVKVDRLMTMDMLGPITFSLFEQIGSGKIWDPDRLVVAPDHGVPGHNVPDSELLKTTREFARKYNLKNYFDIGRHGICHQMMIENGFVLPGTVVVGTDSHSTTYGAMGAFGCGVSTTEAAVIMATGEIWFKVPPTVRFNIIGKLPKGVAAKDIALKIMQLVEWEGKAAYKAIELGGSVIRDFSIDDRMTMTNMLAETGAKNCIVERTLKR